MEYYSWQTMFEEFRRQHKHDPKIREMQDDEIILREAQNIMGTSFKDLNNSWKRLIRLRCEYEWLYSGKPYYNIHPQMVRSLCKTNLSKIPADLIEIPHNLNTVVFRFAEPVVTRYVDNNGMTVVKDDAVQKSPVYCRSVMFSKLRLKDEPDVRKIDPKLVGSDQLMLILDEGFRLKTESGDRTLCNTFLLTAFPGKTIPEAIEDTMNSVSEKEFMVYKGMGHRLVNLFRVIISSGFLANSPEDGLIKPDVLNSDKKKFAEAQTKNDTKAIQNIVNRARKQGKHGYNIGTNEMFVGSFSKLSQTELSASTGKELSFSHIRGGHPHAVRFGEGKNKVKIKWFRPTRVRPDLPFKME